MRVAALLIGALLAVPASARGGSLIAAGGQWAATLKGRQCDAQSRLPAAAGRGREAPLAGFSFTADGSRWGQFHARLSRTPRRGATVIASVGRNDFLLVSRGRWAWSRGPRQDQALIAAVRSGQWLKLRSRDAAGRRFTDSFGLAFAPTAIDSAAARCASLRTGKIR